ncbi:MAG: flippase-like domain-containing protein, partial [Nitrospinota bacterium]
MVRDEETQSAAAETSRRDGRRASWWRWGISLGVFLVILSWIDVGDFASSLTRLQWGTLLLALFLLTLSLVPSRAARLWWFLRIQGHPLTFGGTFRIQWVGHFFGLLLPGTLGTDAWRVWAISRSGERMEGAMAAVAMDRVMGFLGQIANV